MFACLELRVSSLESRVSGLESRVSNLKPRAASREPRRAAPSPHFARTSGTHSRGSSGPPRPLAALQPAVQLPECVLLSVWPGRRAPESAGAPKSAWRATAKRSGERSRAPLPGRPLRRRRRAGSLAARPSRWWRQNNSARRRRLWQPEIGGAALGSGPRKANKSGSETFQAERVAILCVSPSRARAIKSSRAPARRWAGRSISSRLPAPRRPGRGGQSRAGPPHRLTRRTDGAARRLPDGSTASGQALAASALHEHHRQRESDTKRWSRANLVAGGNWKVHSARQLP